MTTYYSRRPPDFEAGSACSGLDCAVANAIDPALAIAWIGAIGLLFGALALTYLPRARERCDEERSRTRAELRAFDAFARRVASIDVSRSETVERPAGGQVAPVSAVGTTANDPDGGIRAVRDAYRETIMAVPHYDEEYDESLEANVAAEFDPAASTALEDGKHLTGPVKRAFVQRAADARERRRGYLDGLERERASVGAASETLADVETALGRANERALIDRSFDDLVDLWHRVRRFGDRVESTLATRQEAVQSGETLGRGFTDPWAMYAHLYRSVGTDHPVLADGTELLEAIRTADRRVIDALTRRV